MTEPTLSQLIARADHSRRIDADFRRERQRRAVRDAAAPPAYVCPGCGERRWRPDGKRTCVGCELGEGDR